MASMGLHKQGYAAGTHIALAPAAATLVPALTGGALPAAAGLPVAAAAAGSHLSTRHLSTRISLQWQALAFVVYMHWKA